MINKIVTPTLTYYEYEQNSFSLLAFSLRDLLRDLKTIHGIGTDFLTLI